MADHHWWSTEELLASADVIFPDGIVDLMKTAVSQPALPIAMRR